MIPDKDNLIKKARRSLGWDEITANLSSIAVSSKGAEIARILIPENPQNSPLESIKTKLRETSEMKEIIAGSENFPLAIFEDISPAISKALKDVPLEILELKDISDLLSISKMVKSFIFRFRENAPTLYKIVFPVDDLSEIKKRIDFCITETGEINENATPEMRELSQKVRSVKNKIIKKLESYISSNEYSQMLMDSYYTQREDRYVLPIKAEYKSKIDGIVHDSSSSGATIFLEPEKLVELNNQLKMAESELKRGIQRIFKGLMVRAGIHIPVHNGSDMAIFPEIYADIGDEQDIGRHLSTFSGHILNIIGMLNFASTSSLILLDELMISTDPSEGGALAEAILTELSGRGVKVITTTHYGQLKATGMIRENFRNASVEFDLKTLSPTYRLIQGIPGGSSALNIAAQLGMDRKIIKLSASLIKEKEKRLEDAVNRLENLKKTLDDGYLKASLVRKDSESLLEEQKNITERIR